MVALARPSWRHAFAGLVGLVLAGAAVAVEWQGQLVLMSEKTVYGRSQSQGRPSAALDLSWQADDGRYLALGLASLGRTGGPAELSVGLGKSGAVPPQVFGGAVGDDVAWLADVTVFGAAGPGRGERPAYVQLGLGLAVGPRLRTGLWLLPSRPVLWGPQGIQRDRLVVVEATWREPLGAGFALDLGAGRVTYHELAVPNYTYGHVGLSWQRGPWQVFVSRLLHGGREAQRPGPLALMSLLWRFH